MIVLKYHDLNINDVPQALLSAVSSNFQAYGFLEVAKQSKPFVVLSCRCGVRGAYMEVINMDPGVKKYLLGLQAPSSPPVLPQLTMEVMVNPPAPGDPSYEKYKQVSGESKFHKKFSFFLAFV